MTMQNATRARMRRPLAAIAALFEFRFLRFLLAGGVNTAFGYCVFYVLLRLTGIPILALALGTILGVLFNFMTMGSFVFKRMERRRLRRFIAVYCIVFVYSALALKLLASIGIDAAIGGLVQLPGVIAIAFVLNRAFVFSVAEQEASEREKGAAK